MKIKRILLCTILLLIAGSFYINKEASAANVNNLDYLYEKARLGISDLSTSQMENIFESIDIQVTEETTQYRNFKSSLMKIPEVATYATAELLESDGDTQLFSVTIFNDISLFEDFQPANFSTFALWPGDLTDHTGSVRAYLNLDVEASTVAGGSFIRLKGGSGNWTILDSRVQSITNRKVEYANFGLNGTNGLPVSQAFGPYFLSSNSFSHSLASNPVSTATEHQLSGKMNATLSTAASSWNFQMVLRFPETASYY